MGAETRLPLTAAGSLLGAALLTTGRRTARRKRVLAGRGDENFLVARSGNALSFRATDTKAAEETGRPLIVFESGFLATMEHWAWVSEKLEGKESTVFYDRSGYGRSRHKTPLPVTPRTIVSDLVDLVRHTRGKRRVVLVGHAMGAGIVLQAAAELEDVIAGTVLLEPPVVTAAPGAEPSGRPHDKGIPPLFVGSMRIGCGDLLPRPSWAGMLPEHSARLRDDQYRDARLWQAAEREAAAGMGRGVHEGLLARVPSPTDVIAHRDADLSGYRGLRLMTPHVLDGFRPGRLLLSRHAAERAAEIVSEANGRVR
ncbi:alpha/beta hydrolase [Streptomyces sp. NPDC058718]|uniref:alpha/beta hydrolase n=1 Tax=Streptomyces sp. NPDC058718 TaxID=3346610 RepID=UPI0036ACA611